MLLLYIFIQTYQVVIKVQREKQEGHDGPVSLHWLIHEIPSYQALQYLGIGLKHTPQPRTEIVSHSSYIKQQEDFERLYHMKPCKTCNPWQSIRP